MSSSAGKRRKGPAAAAGMLLALLAAGLVVLAAGTAAADVDGDPDAGRELFANNCAACHGPAAQGAGSAPALAGVTERLGAEQVARTIREGRGGMPAFGGRLDEEQIGHLVAHLGQLPEDEAADENERSEGPMMHGRWRDMMGGWPWGIAVLGLVVVVVALALVGAGVARFLGRSGAAGAGRDTSAPPSSRAREILDQRYARGELSRDEYLRARHDLEESG